MTLAERDSARSRGIVLYDFLYCRGGAERVTLELAEGLGDADLCFAFRDERHFPDAVLAGFSCFDLGVRVGGPGSRTIKGLYAFRTRTGFLRPYDWVIYSGSVAPEAVYHHRHGRNIYYCHTIPRFAYDLYDDYLAQLRPWQRPLFTAMVHVVRYRYARALRRMDLVVANSENVRRRLHRYLGVDATVVYPPCDVDGYRWIDQKDYYLSTARLEPYKRVDLIVEAFKRLPGKRLIVSSGGGDEARLRHLAADAENIEFAGWTSDARQKALIGSAIATLYVPKDEDFGMSPVESMAAGKPVIAAAEGGLKETVVDGETGLLLKAAPTVTSIVEAVHALDAARAGRMRAACQARARLFTRERFLKQMQSLVSPGGGVHLTEGRN